MTTALTDARARCRDLRNPDALYDTRASVQHRIAKHVCRPCELRLDCLAEALTERIEFGVWGGMTSRQRTCLLREHPEVTDWRAHLAAQERPPARLSRKRDARLVTGDSR